MENRTSSTAASPHQGVVRFERNFNNKLSGEYFTSIRLGSGKYQRGSVLKLLLWENGTYRTLGMVRVLEVKPLRLRQINPYISYLDTGMDVESTIDHIYRLYKDQVKDPLTCEYVLVLFERVRERQLQSSLFT